LPAFALTERIKACHPMIYSAGHPQEYSQYCHASQQDIENRIAEDALQTLITE
jgi:hypothetical protein